MNYGLLGNNLPPPALVVEHLKYHKITKVRIFQPYPDVLQALKGSEIEVFLGTLNEDLERLAADQSFANKWVQDNILAYIDGVKFRYITAGNEVIPGPYAQYVLGAMQNLKNALDAAKVNIPVSTVVALTVLGSSYPPSNATFSNESLDTMSKIVAFLSQNQYPMFANVYPCFAYFQDPKIISEEYALGNKNAPAVEDGTLKYNNMFEAMVDSVYAALEKVGGNNVKVVVSETGWPSAGGEFATVSHARSYVTNVIHLLATAKGKGTPRRPEFPVETYIFALFNENLKPPGTEQNFGIYHPDTRAPVYVTYFPNI